MVFDSVEQNSCAVGSGADNLLLQLLDKNTISQPMRFLSNVFINRRSGTEQR